MHMGKDKQTVPFVSWNSPHSLICAPYETIFDIDVENSLFLRIQPATRLSLIKILILVS